MELSKRRKIFYTPGLISLVLLPLICYIYLKSDYRQRQVKLMEVIFSDSIHDIHHKRNFMNIRVTGNTELDNKKLRFAKKQIHIINQSKNKTKGILLIFDDNAKYGAYVKALNDIWLLEEVGHGLMHKNKIWMYYDDPNNVPYNYIHYIIPTTQKLR